MLQEINKIEIEHIIGYVPFALKAYILDFKSDYVGKEIDTIVGVNQWSKCGLLWSLKTLGGSKPSPDRIKPILYRKDDMKKSLKREMFMIHDEYFYNLPRLSSALSLFFYKNHIDVNGLIDLGLAVDGNILKKH